MPVTPIAESASRTSSSLKGLMIAVTSFIAAPVYWKPRVGRPRLGLKRLLDVNRPGAFGDVARVDAAFADTAVANRVRARGVGVERADGEVLRQCVRDSHLPVVV